MERRRKATLPAVLGTPEHCGLIRRDLVVCPPFWLLPRIETGDSFLWACCAPLLRLHPQGNVPAWAFAGRAFRRLWGMSVPFSLSAPLLCQIIVAILCGNFEQFANKRPAGTLAVPASSPERFNISAACFAFSARIRVPPIFCRTFLSLCSCTFIFCPLEQALLHNLPDCAPTSGCPFQTPPLPQASPSPSPVAPLRWAAGPIPMHKLSIQKEMDKQPVHLSKKLSFRAEKALFSAVLSFSRLLHATTRPGFLLRKPGRFVYFICAFGGAHAKPCGGS